MDIAADRPEMNTLALVRRDVRRHACDELRVLTCDLRRAEDVGVGADLLHYLDDKLS